MNLRKLSLAVLLAVFAAGVVPLHAETNVLFIFDSSGSMKKKVDNGEARMTVAKRAMAQALKDMPAGVRVGLLLYGHRKAKDCTDIELKSPIGADDAAAIARIVGDLKPKGETPIAAALEQAIRSFAALKGQSNRVVLVTDGIEECGGDVCAAAQTVADAGLDLKVDVVGFTLTEKQAQTIRCIPEKTGGKYYEASNATGLTAAFNEVTQQVQTAAAVPKDESLIAAANGGVLVAAPNDEWRKLNDGATDRATTYDGEGIWSFKDGKPATFDSFEVLIPGTDQYNLHEFELLAGDDGPLGQFRPIGVFNTQNIKMMQAPYQRFTFPPVTARYLKVVLRTDWGGGYIASYEFRLLGKLDELAAAAAAASGVDLLSPTNGGVLLAAPNDEWLKLNDSAEDRATTYGGAGVWAFRDGKPATFDTFEVLIPGKDQYNLKDFELFVGDEGPLGSFRSIGKFSTQNMKMMQAPYQKFTFPPVTARYLKVVLATDHGGGYIASYEFRVQGKIDDSAAAAAAAQAPAGIDLLAQANGGQLLAAPNDEWMKLNDGEDKRATTYSGAGVWGFKDGKPATFDSFEVLIPGSDQYNLKDFELFVGDEGPTGAFRSIGKFAAQNIKMMQSPYQRFTFAPVTAKYLKVVFETDQGGGYIAAYDLRLFGRIDEAATAAATAQAPAGVDLLAQSNGGQLLAAPNDEWLKLNDGAADRATTYSGEGVWGFKDGKPATFDSFEVLIPGQDQYNLKDFELLVGDEGPTGAFRSIGQFTTQNMKMMQSAYQRFTFAPVTAKYLKVVFKTDHGGGYIAAYDLRLFGTLGP